MSNKFKGTGNLGKAPELKYINTTDGQRAVANFSVRFDRDKRLESGEYVDNGGFWLDVAIFGSQAERVVKVISKGNRVYVEGSLKQHEWEKEGQLQTRLVLEASYLALDLLGIESVQFQEKNKSHQAVPSNKNYSSDMDNLPPIEEHSQETVDATG